VSLPFVFPAMMHRNLVSYNGSVLLALVLYILTDKELISDTFAAGTLFFEESECSKIPLIVSIEVDIELVLDVRSSPLVFPILLDNELVLDNGSSTLFYHSAG